MEPLNPALDDEKEEDEESQEMDEESDYLTQFKNQDKVTQNSHYIFTKAVEPLCNPLSLDPAANIPIRKASR